MNDLLFYVKDICNIALFADYISPIIQKIGKSKIMMTCFKINLVLNANKIKCIVFALSKIKHPNYNLTINNERLIVSDTTVFWWINLDSKLQWNCNSSSLTGRLSSAWYAVKKVRQLTDVAIARLIIIFQLFPQCYILRFFTVG